MRILLALALLALLAGCAAPTATNAPVQSLSARTSPLTYVERLVGTSGAEPSIGITSSGAIFVTSDDLVRSSTDNGTTWKTSYEFGSVHTGVGTGITNDPISNFDAMLWVDPLTSRIFAPLMWPILTCSEAITSDDDGAHWQDLPLGCGIPGMDHQRLATGPYVKGGLLQATPLYPNAVYFCYSKVVTYHCATSLDGGLHFPIDRLVATKLDCGGPGGTPHADANGTVYAPLGGLGGCDKVAIGVSRDNGLTWTVKEPKIGDLGQDEIDPDITTTPDGTAYYVFRASKDHVVYMLRSKDGFDTVDGPFRIAAPDIKSTNFAQITSGDDGKIAIAYAGTRDTDKFANDAPDNARWHLFIATSLDAESATPTFATSQATPADDPLQVGSIHYGGGNAADRNLLEFIDAATAPDGHVVVVFTDGCTEKCAGRADAKPADSHRSDTAVAVQIDGALLRAAPAKD